MQLEQFSVPGAAVRTCLNVSGYKYVYLAVNCIVYSVYPENRTDAIIS